MPALSHHDFPPLPSQRTKRQRQKTTSRSAIASKNGRSIATINNLPEELILDILDWVCGVDTSGLSPTRIRPEAIPILASLSLTNRRLHRIVRDRLYATYHGHIYQPYLFLRTMISNPSLAATVQRLEIKPPGFDDELEARKYYIATAVDKKTIKAGIKALDIPNWKDWATDCNSMGKSNPEILYTAILMHTPNITTLKIHGSPTRSSTPPKWIDIIKRATSMHSFGKVHSFQHLQFLHIDVLASPFHHLTPIFLLQSLHTLHIRHLTEISNNHSSPSIRRLISPSSNNLKVLYLEKCLIHTPLLSILLSSPRSLHSFTYTLPTDSLSEDTNHPDSPDTPKTTLTNMLAPQRHTLQALKIHYYSSTEKDTAHPPSLDQTLTSFTALQHLTCPLPALLPTHASTPSSSSSSSSSAEENLFSILPSSLTTLHISIPPTQTITSIKHNNNNSTTPSNLTPTLSSLTHTHPPSLSSLTLHIDPRSTHNWTPLSILFSSAGIDFAVKVDREDDDDDDYDYDEDEGEDQDFSLGGWTWRDDRGGASDSSLSSADEVDLYSDHGKD